MSANQFESKKSVMSFDSLESAKAGSQNKAIKRTKLALPLNLVAAMILVCGVVLPVQAESNQPEDNWNIAKKYVDKFFDMKDKDIADLFDYHEHKETEYVIAIDEKTELQINKVSPFNFNEFSFLRKPSLPQTSYRESIRKICGSDAMEDVRFSAGHDAIWTGAKRKDEKEYWKIIKANLDKFIGMSAEEIAALLGPERCSSKQDNLIKYRVGNAGLTFYLKDGKVQRFKFKSDVYIPGT